MKIRNIEKADVQNMLSSKDLYLIRIKYKDNENGQKNRCCYIKHVLTMPVKTIFDAIADENASFIEIIEES